MSLTQTTDTTYTATCDKCGATADGVIGSSVPGWRHVLDVFNLYDLCPACAPGSEQS